MTWNRRAAVSAYQDKGYKGKLFPPVKMTDGQRRETGFEYRIRSEYAYCRASGLSQMEAFEVIADDLNSWADYWNSWDNSSWTQEKQQIARSMANTDSIQSVIDSSERRSCPNKLADALLKLASEPYTYEHKRNLAECFIHEDPKEYKCFVFDEDFYDHIEKLHNNSRPYRRRGL